MLILDLKGANLDQKGPKMGGAGFFPNRKPPFSKRRPPDKFLYLQARNTEVSWRRVNPPWGTNENFLAHSTEARSFRATISNICAKNHQYLIRSFENISPKGPF